MLFYIKVLSKLKQIKLRLDDIFRWTYRLLYNLLHCIECLVHHLYEGTAGNMSGEHAEMAAWRITHRNQSRRRFPSIARRCRSWIIDLVRCIKSKPNYSLEGFDWRFLAWFVLLKWRLHSSWLNNWYFFLDYTLGSSNQKNCDFDTFPGTTQVCKIDVSSFDQCTSSNAYGYNNSSPCIFLKLNRIYGWVPDFYNDPNDLPEEMPADLKAHIAQLPESHRKQVWVSCYGENGADQEILGDISYYPTRGFPSYFYPYLNAPGYLSPLVAVKFVRPSRKFSSHIECENKSKYIFTKIRHPSFFLLANQIINIECRAWAKNIKYVGSFRDRQVSEGGLMTFFHP